VDPDRAGGSVVIDGSNNTLAGVRDAINSANLGVKARVVDDGSGFRLVLTGTQAGAKNSLEITTGSGASPGLAALAFNQAASTANVNLSQTAAATDAVVNVDGIPVRRTSNAISGVVDGITFNLTEANVGQPATVTVARNTGSAVARVQSFADAYNSLKSLADTLTAYDPKSKTGGLLIGDPTLRTVLSQVRRTLSAVVTQLPANGPRGLADIGLTTNQNNGFKLAFDSSKLVAALAASPEAVKGLFASTSSTSDSLVTILNAGARSQAGSYDVRVARLATQASLVGAARPGLDGPITIDGSNDTLQVTVDGVNSGTISLTQKSYATGEELASELQQQINADAALRAGTATIAVTYDGTAKTLRLQSARYGSTSSVGILTVDTATTATLGLTVQSAATNKGLNVAGSINGVQALGSSQVLTLTGTAPSATTGRFLGNQVGVAPIVIDAANKTFVVRVDGVTTQTVTLAEGSYATGAALASELQGKINADTNLQAQQKRVTVAHDEGGRAFTFFSGSTGASSEVAFTSVPAPTAAALGIFVGDGLKGHPGGNSADAAAGAQLKVLGGGVGDRGRFSVVRGLMHQLGGVFDSVLGSTGAIANRIDGLNGRLTQIEAETRRIDTRIAATEARLRTQFTAADKLISQLNSTSSFLTQQLASLNNSRDN
jgi:flagellar hook-associated protein 2